MKSEIGDETKTSNVSELETLEAIQDRVLWLSTRMIDYANADRPNLDGLKVGGHQASSASMVSILTALYFDFLDSEFKAKQISANFIASLSDTAIFPEVWYATCTS